MDQTPNLKLPFILPSQAQKHVTHNEALRLLDTIVQLSVKSRSVHTPPDAPLPGECYIIAPPASGLWASHEGMIAAFIDDSWIFIRQSTGWVVYVEDESSLLVFNGAAWNAAVANSDALSLSMLGIQATADAINRFVISAQASLFNNDGGGHQIKVNKYSDTDTASLLFQTNWTGHAEMGLNGENHFSIKVGDDTGDWREAVRVDSASGNVAIGSVWPQTKLHVDGPIRPASYSVSTLPSAISHGAGAMAFVTDTSNGAEIVYSDGSNWRNIRAGEVIA